MEPLKVQESGCWRVKQQHVLKAWDYIRIRLHGGWRRGRRNFARNYGGRPLSQIGGLQFAMETTPHISDDSFDTSDLDVEDLSCDEDAIGIPGCEILEKADQSFGKAHALRFLELVKLTKLLGSILRNGLWVPKDSNRGLVSLTTRIARLSPTATPFVS